MSKSEFIENMKGKGFEITTQNGESFLCKSMETIHIYNDGHISYSSPGGNSQYKTVDDFNNGNSYSSENYKL
jgi:hypothetical protein